MSATVTRGRPRIFSPKQRRTVAKYLRKYGLTEGHKMVRIEGGIKLSIATANSIAKEFGIEFTRGRPIGS
jgi:hypothetical protein